MRIEEIKLIGLALNGKTTNANGQANIDCGNLWQEFEKGKYAERIPNKLTGEVLAVYHQYEGDHTKPYSYFIGCKVASDTEVPQGLETLTIAAGNYQTIDAKGKMPDCIINTWKKIWDSNIPRSYTMDFEVYDEKSKDWSNAEVKVFLAIEN
ncbi:MAG: AraC family transcriptional regulator [Flavisolibacter sp.]|nr:AraC family transcriptional regulator [Flavisolibacter sp.]